VKRHAVFNALCHAANILLVTSILLTAYGAAWEYSTRCYLKGFSEAVVPYSASAEQKVEAILAWMEHAPARRATTPAENPAARDPENTLNYGRLLRVCGTATNAFVNLADSSGLEARRLLLLSPSRNTNHVVAEVRLDGRWVVVDPAFHAILRDAYGRALTRVELANPKILQEATRNLPSYDPQYNYGTTAHVRLTRVPFVGRFLRRALDSLLPSWEESFDWTLLVERESYAVFVVGILFLVLSLFSRLLLAGYARRQADIVRVSLREQLGKAGTTLLGRPLEHL
jgi:Transglutaminase-like superfamily